MPRIYLKHMQTSKLIESLNRYFEREIDIPRVKKGKRQKLESLINEEASLLAKYIRNEKPEWKPRIEIP